ncbi:tetratricopeptide repeat protein [Pseudobacter ginsenosidimutans]|uniref:Tetratricopeptide repeat protein n=1 Tax=Pseudobacter ginsenosidimutans TaxID=661488 RepID=A0A4Q7MSD3_9BACT|nr:tetratricopeptide repeat protein [Pseudobacter ginsenosidimutans]QEC41506.1 tetratricopeptide repeat protein [Pseudobacter ginsenosidimutans]RZS71712.1 tetratricopeptide repeat protein [Pseudobacter ginsenosidimutans]
MKLKMNFSQSLVLLFCLLLFACKESRKAPSRASIDALNLKKGQLITCGPSQQLGTLHFAIDAPAATQSSFMLGLKLLHSFEYDEAEKVFAGIIDQNPDCAMAYWGVAMSNFHPLWAPPSKAELQKGSAAIAIARGLKPASKKESSYIEAIASFYDRWQQTDHKTRCLRFEKAMEDLHEKDSSDMEATVLYALALDAAANPSDKNFKKQKKAGELLQSLAPGAPDHPGIAHYLIHTYDVPELASLALPAARKYASIAPSSAHALHMPSHIFTRLGLWDEAVQSNIASVSSAQCYAQQNGMKHWDEELHGLDYLMYAYLQKGDTYNAKKQLDYLLSIHETSPANFKVAYSFAAIPARYYLESRNWKEAARLPFPVANFSWDDFLWQKAIIHFARVMGAVHTGQTKISTEEIQELKRIRDTLAEQGDTYKAQQVSVQLAAGEAWAKLRSGKKGEALQLMQLAAKMEDSTEKHPVTPAEVLPAKELLGDMLMELKDYQAALEAYEQNLKRHPNRFNALLGAAQAASKTGEKSKAIDYYHRLISIAVTNSPKPELQLAKQSLEEMEK